MTHPNIDIRYGSQHSTQGGWCFHRLLFSLISSLPDDGETDQPAGGLIAHKTPFVVLCIPPTTIQPDTIKNIYDGGQSCKKNKPLKTNKQLPGL